MTKTKINEDKVRFQLCYICRKKNLLKFSLKPTKLIKDKSYVKLLIEINHVRTSELMSL